MKEPLFRGSATALVTPFFEDGSVDFESLGRLIEFQIAGGTDALVACGTTGESATVTERERLSVIEYTVWKTNRRIPVIAGTGTNCTAQSVSVTQRAADLGVQGILAVCPYYNKPTPEGVIAHYAALAECSDLPVIVYNVPGRTGCEISPEVLRVLSAHPKILGLKQANGSAASVARIRNLCGDDLPIYAGDDGLIVSMMALGAIGVVSVGANLFPRRFRRLCEKALSGDFPGAAEEQIRLMPVIDALFFKTNPIPVKAALEWLGFPPQHLRLPLVSLSDAEKQRLFALLDSFSDGG